MTDEAMKDLVSKHDTAITQLASSVEHLITAQTETNIQLKEISKYLAKQVIFDSKLEDINRKLNDSFKRVHQRIDEVEDLQTGDVGCHNIRLITKDIDTLTKDTIRLVGVIEEHRFKVEGMGNTLSKYPSTVAIRWGVGIFIAYSVMFGTYVVKSINAISQVNVKLTEVINRDTSDIVKIDEKLDKLATKVR